MIDRKSIKMLPLSKFLAEYKELNSDDLYRPVAIGRYGIRTRESIYSKELAKDYSKNKLIHKGTLTVGMGSVQMDIGILSEDTTYSVSPAYHTYKIEGINYDYLRYCLQCRNTDMFTRYMKRGSRQGKSIDLDRWITYEIPVYPSQAQEEIVDIIDKVQAIINLHQKQLIAINDIIIARFVEMFGDPEINPMGWPVKTLDTLLSVEPQNGLYKPQSDYVIDGSGTPILRIDAFYDGKVTSFLGLKRLQCSEVEKNRYLLKENDIVINRVNSMEYLGKCAWITGMVEPTVFESNMMRFHANEAEIDPCFLTRLLCSSYIYKQILYRAKKAVNQASINQGDVQSFRIVVPPLSLQRQFAAFVSQIDTLKSTVQKSLEETQSLFDSLLQQYFG